MATHRPTWPGPEADPTVRSAKREKRCWCQRCRVTEAAVDRLVALALEESVSVRDLCARKFKDYQFGLKLIAQNTGQNEFDVDVDVVEAPDKALSDWVVASYRSAQ